MNQPTHHIEAHCELWTARERQRPGLTAPSTRTSRHYIGTLDDLGTIAGFHGAPFFRWNDAPCVNAPGNWHLATYDMTNKDGSLTRVWLQAWPLDDHAYAANRYPTFAQTNGGFDTHTKNAENQPFA